MVVVLQRPRRPASLAHAPIGGVLTRRRRDPQCICVSLDPHDSLSLTSRKLYGLRSSRQAAIVHYQGLVAARGGMANHLYYGDNLDVLREHIKDESVDLIYLDPPFNSNATYNVLFRSPVTGNQSQAQIEAFEDTWHWNTVAEKAFDEVMQGRNGDVADMLRAMRSFLKDNDMMAYLTHMAVRLVELHRVLKPAGSIYLHCDPTASHYLKVLMDAVFGDDNSGR